MDALLLESVGGALREEAVLVLEVLDVVGRENPRCFLLLKKLRSGSCMFKGKVDMKTMYKKECRKATLFKKADENERREREKRERREREKRERREREKRERGEREKKDTGRSGMGKRRRYCIIKTAA